MRGIKCSRPYWVCTSEAGNVRRPMARPRGPVCASSWRAPCSRAPTPNVGGAPGIVCELRHTCVGGFADEEAPGLGPGLSSGPTERDIRSCRSGYRIYATGRTARWHPDPSRGTGCRSLRSRHCRTGGRGGPAPAMQSRWQALQKEVGTSRHFAAAQQFGRIWSEADINRRAGFMSTP